VVLLKFESKLGSQISRLQVGFELDPAASLGTVRLQQLSKLFHCKPSLANQSSKSPFRPLFVIWNGKAPMRGIAAPEKDVAAVLLIDFVSGFSECLDCLGAGNNRQPHPPTTSMTSSIMLGGTGSPCFLKLMM
jgi:hypothetical protein